MNALRAKMKQIMTMIAVSATVGSFETLTAATRYTRRHEQSATVQSNSDAWGCKVCGKFQ